MACRRHNCKGSEMKKGLLVVVTLILLGLTLVNTANAQPPVVVSVRDGVVGIEASGLGAYDITVYGKNIEVFEGIYAIDGEQARICGWCVPVFTGYKKMAKAERVEVNELVDFDGNDLEYVITVNHTNFIESFIQRVIFQLWLLSWYN